MGIMGSLKWNELFPTKMGAVVFVSYMALFINQGKKYQPFIQLGKSVNFMVIN